VCEGGQRQGNTAEALGIVAIKALHLDRGFFEWNSLDTHGADLVGIKLGYDSSNFREKNRDSFTMSAELQYG
jgi:hypothetical protein